MVEVIGQCQEQLASRGMGGVHSGQQPCSAEVLAEGCTLLAFFVQTGATELSNYYVEVKIGRGVTSLSLRWLKSQENLHHRVFCLLVLVPKKRQTTLRPHNATITRTTARTAVAAIGSVRLSIHRSRILRGGSFFDRPQDELQQPRSR